jgi:hypothetical protein
VYAFLDVFLDFFCSFFLFGCTHSLFLVHFVAFLFMAHVRHSQRFQVANANSEITIVQRKKLLGGLVLKGGNLVGPTGIEPATSAMSRQRSNQLSYGPKEECEIYTSALAGASPNTLDKISDKNYCHIQF